jgi:hypothetical protein
MATARKYGNAAQKSVKSAVHRAKAGTLKAGKGRHPKAKSRKQAIAIGLSEARKKGAKVPPRKSSGRRTKRTTRGRASTRSSSSRKSA